MEPFWRAVAELSPGASLIEEDEVTAAIVPLAPNRSFFNSVLYRNPGALAAKLDALAAAYEKAGINAWTVWTLRSHASTAELLEAAGHARDAQPRIMVVDDLSRIE